MKQTQPQTQSRELDPNVLQRNASNPQSSVWVSASAGTGKTKVLTDRVLRLLLPQDNGDNGCAPHKILGLTFTKAAASEMALRINETLAAWAIMPLDGDKGLKATLNKLLGRPPRDIDVNAARKGFANIIDTPGRLKIMTIHAFCQSTLARFPLESDITPGFKVAEGRMTADLLNQARNIIFKEATTSPASPTNQAIQHLSETISEDQLDQLINGVNGERGQFKKILKENFGIDGLYTAICTHLNIAPNTHENESIKEHFTDSDFDYIALKNCADIMSESTATDIKNAAHIHHALSLNTDEKITYFNQYKSTFFTQKNEIRASLCSKKITKKLPHINESLQKEALRIQTTQNTINAAKTAALTRDLLLLCNAILEKYIALKTQKNILDYEDLIFKTRDLMQTRGPWVHYKLDQGIDHILVDEAQDTNPEQWSIIEALCDEFFPKHSQSETNRSIFIVGDEKQSIYSFQRASPEEFERMRTFFADKIKTAHSNNNWRQVGLNISFRSTQSILEIVDNVFASTQNRQGMGATEINHTAFRRGQAGLVELWPIFENDKKTDEASTWEPPITITNHKTGATKLAEEIAQTISKWRKNKKQLESHNREIQPRDIMILVQTRNAFVNQLIRALKTNDIPVGGLDRIVLNDELAVQDMLAASDFTLLPSDDLTLASLLKSPLIGMDEDTLFEIAYNRKTTLWQAVKDKASPKITDYLTRLISKSKTLTPYAFFANILQSTCPADSVSAQRGFQKRLGLDAMDALNEFLNAAMKYESDNTPSLQGFTQWQRAEAEDIKRQNDDQNNHVRIMTVHGSKGLQAPIVFLPDTTRLPRMHSIQAANSLLWPNQTGLKLPLWSPRKDTQEDTYTAAKKTVQSRMNEEYRRLLYVAMTRAEDSLYVSGFIGKGKVSEECWYSLIKQGLEENPNHTKNDEGVAQLQNAQNKPADRKTAQESQAQTNTPIPKWMYETAKTEQSAPKPLSPSRPAEIEPSALSPTKADNNYRFRRGNVTHTLLQFLPELEPNTHQSSITEYLGAHANDLPESVRSDIKDEVLKILNDPTFAPIFSQESRAEVPITGLLPDGRLISGQIDRLLITDNEILIVDFKTNRPPPNNPKDVPKIYYNQLKSYADTLKEIYPNRTIKCALLWTDGPNLMPIEIPE